jgi:hypothetical protein
MRRAGAEGRIRVDLRSAALAPGATFDALTVVGAIPAALLGTVRMELVSVRVVLELGAQLSPRSQE